MDDFDIYISNIVSKRIYEPPKYKDTIEATLKDYNSKSKFSIINYISKIITAIVASICVIGGCAFAIKILNKANSNENSSSAVNSDYVQILDMNYKTIDDLAIKVNSILMDDFKIELNIDYLYNKPITSANSKIVVRDEENNILYNNDIVIDYYDVKLKAADRNSFIKNKKINDGISYNQDIATETDKAREYTVGYKCCDKNISSNNVEKIISLYTNLDTYKFPNSKRVYIQLENVVLKNDKNIVKEIKGEWNFEIDINDNLRNRRTWEYREINSKMDNNFKILDAKLSNVQLLLKIENKGNIDLANLKFDSIQILDEKNMRYIVPESMEVKDGNIIDVNYNISSEMFPNIINGKIEEYQEFYLERVE